MKCISWNVNGLRACMGKGFMDFFKSGDADIFCLQEHKLSPNILELELPGYHQYWAYANKKGYSGTAVFSRKEPLNVCYELPGKDFGGEGRVVTLEFDKHFFITAYTPNAQRELARLGFRMEWEDAFRAYLMELDAKKPVVLCGDLNVAHEEIDLKHPKANRGNAGFSDEERACFTELLGAGFIDSFRRLYPDARDAYTWWSYMHNARQSNSGWRIDYFVLSASIAHEIEDALIYSDVYGSDHCPVGLLLNADLDGF